MRFSILTISFIIFFASCSNRQNEKNINSNKDTIRSNEFYKNGTGIMTKVEYDSFITKSKKRSEGKDFKIVPEIVSEIQSGDSLIYNVDFHILTTNNKLIGKPLPDFSFKDLEDKTVKSSELKGKPVIINLWFVECPPCIAEMPTLNSIKDRYANTDIQFLSMTYETKLRVKNFLEKRKINFRIIPEIGKYSDILASNFPQTIFVNRAGIITDIQNGMIPIYDKKSKKPSDKMEETDFINALYLIK